MTRIRRCFGVLLVLGMSAVLLRHALADDRGDPNLKVLNRQVLDAMHLAMDLDKRVARLGTKVDGVEGDLARVREPGRGGTRPVGPRIPYPGDAGEEGDERTDARGKIWVRRSRHWFPKQRGFDVGSFGRYGGFEVNGRPYQQLTVPDAALDVSDRGIFKNIEFEIHVATVVDTTSSTHIYLDLHFRYEVTFTKPRKLKTPRVVSLRIASGGKSLDMKSRNHGQRFKNDEQRRYEYRVRLDTWLEMLWHGDVRFEIGTKPGLSGSLTDEALEYFRWGASLLR